LKHSFFQRDPATVKTFDGIRAGEEKPVETIEVSEGSIEWTVGCRGGDLDCGNQDGGRTESFKQSGQFGSLVAGASDEDAFSGKGKHIGIVGCGSLFDLKYSFLRRRRKSQTRMSLAFAD
jgi:hypothetical protein